MKFIKRFKNYYFGLIVVLFALPTMALAQGGGVCTVSTGIAQKNFRCVVGFLTDAINQLVFILIGFGLLAFLWGLVKYIAAGGDEEKIKEAKRFIVFGLIAFFVMMSVWGLVNILINTFFDSGTSLLVPGFK